ncbi:MAG: ATP synthase F1 subunit epsilon [Bacteroidales bacterium]|nr:ATP synthase F1 subunit epsilon [Bacteroidales bacterium]MCF8457177.1 ATP synthase F1 subunit epsilon [Bacteroidales bacterium]
MFVEIVTPDKKIFSGEATLAQLPGSNGSFEIMNNHAPIISTLNRGKVRIIAADGKEYSFDIAGGVIESAENKIIILAETK